VADKKKDLKKKGVNKMSAQLVGVILILAGVVVFVKKINFGFGAALIVIGAAMVFLS